jgi:prepilin-type N-terminal cleavage/methylation domain-containing protein
MKQIKGNKGFGLVECVIAMLLICIALVGMTSHIGVSMAAMQTDKATSVASSLLQDKAEAIKQTPYNSIATGGDSIAQGGVYYARSWNVTTSGNMKTVALSIVWNGRTMNTSVVITL